MKQKLIVLLLGVTFLSFGVHPMHICITQINVNSSHESLEIIHRIFWDDLEKALQQNHPNLRLGQESETPNAQEYVKNYMQNKFALQVNGKNLKMNYLGTEYEEEILLVYMEVPHVKSLKTAKIRHAVLHELFEDQRNIINFVLGKKKVGEMTIPSKPVADFSF